MKVSNSEKILFSKSKISKQDLVDYYTKISPYFLKHVKNHLIVLQRFPNGIDAPSFYQKQISDYFPSFITHKTIRLKKGSSQTLTLIDSKKSLTYLANQATIVFHSWLSNVENPNKPDKIVFDLDPAKKDLKLLRFAALEIKKIIESHKLHPFVMTTGSRGYHVVVPIIPEHSFAKVHNFAKKIAMEVAQKYPKILTTHVNIKTRKGRIFIDYLRNSYGQTSVAAYSVRALEKAPVATPISWQELFKTVPQKYTIQNIFKRLKTKGDVWKNFRAHAKKLYLK